MTPQGARTRWTVVWTAPTAAMLMLELAACGSTSHPSHPTHAAVAQQPAAATQSQSCADLVHAWAHDQGTAQLNQISHDTRVAAKDGRRVSAALGRGSNAASQFARLQGDETALETDAQAATSNPPPACANAAEYGTAMQDYETGAKDEISAISDISLGSYTAGGKLIRAAASAINGGNNAMSQANATLNSLNG